MSETKVTFYSTSGEPVSFEDAHPNEGLVSVALNPSCSVQDPSPQMDILIRREETGWVTRTKPKGKAE